MTTLVSIELNDAALKSLDLENYTKKKILDDYRKELAEEYTQIQQIKNSNKVKKQREKEDYIKM